MLKIYKNRRLSITQNLNVENCIANGAMCKFLGINLHENARKECIETILIDDFYVNCIEACNVESVTVEMLDGNHDCSNPRVTQLPILSVTACAYFPMALDGAITKQTNRLWRKIKFSQFPVSVADARTVHKLQGRSLQNIMIPTWNYQGNWVYVVLSRCSTLKGVFLRSPLKKSKPMSKENKRFHMEFRKTKKPKDIL